MAVDLNEIVQRAIQPLHLSASSLMYLMQFLPKPRAEGTTGPMNAPEHVQDAFKYIQAAIHSLEAADAILLTMRTPN